MTNQEFLQHILTKRIEMILSEQRQEDMDRNIEVLDRIMTSMDPDDKEKLNRWLNQLTDMEADGQRQAYLGGLKDGIYLSVMFLEYIL